MTAQLRSILHRVLLFLLLWAVAISAEAGQQSPDDARALLLEVRKNMLKTIDRLPKYVCTETVDRATFQSEIENKSRSCDDLKSRKDSGNWKIRKSSSDRLRLDVAVSSDGEMYSWAGGDSFDDRGLADLVRGGATSTGTFSSFINSIFGTDAATFTYDGDVHSGEQVFVEFGFRMPVEKSKYSIGNRLYRAIVGYDGVFLVDPKTFNVVRLTIRASQLPPELNACESNTTLDYASVRLNNTDFLLPKDVYWRTVNPDGSEFRNHTVFSGCHEFLGESSIRFDAPVESAQVTVTKHIVDIPAELSFSLALTSPIDIATAAAGDLFRAKLITAIREKRSRVLVPKGAAITGRIVRVERIYDKASQSLLLAVKLETVEANGGLQLFHARLGPIAHRRKKDVDALVLRQDLGSFDEILYQEDPAIGRVRFDHVTDDYVIKTGLEITGKTTGVN